MPIFGEGIAEALRNRSVSSAVLRPPCWDEWFDLDRRAALVIDLDAAWGSELLAHPRMGAAVRIGVVSRPSATLYRSAFRAGVDACFDRESACEFAVRVILAALRGEVLLQADTARELATRTRIDPPVPLNEEEEALLRALAQGATVSAIATRLCRSERDAYRVLKRLYVQIGVAGRAEAIASAASWGLVGPCGATDTAARGM